MFKRKNKQQAPSESLATLEKRAKLINKNLGSLTPKASRVVLFRLNKRVFLLEKKLASLQKLHGSKNLKGKKDVEYNRSLLMPYYRPEVVEAIARKRITPLLENNLTLKKHRFGEDAEKEYRYQLVKMEVLEDVCRVNNWITRKDWIEKKVPVNQTFVDLFKAAVKYSDVLKYYAKLRFDARTKSSAGL